MSIVNPRPSRSEKLREYNQRPERKEAIQRYRQKSKENDNRKQTQVRIKPETWDRLREAADEREVSMNFLAARAIEEFLNRLIPVDEIRFTRPPSPQEPTERMNDDR